MPPKKAAKEASQIWAALDNLAKTDPIKYRSFIKEQIDNGRKMTSAPEPDLLIHVGTRNPRFSSIYISICSWSRLPGATKDEDPFNVIGGQPYEVTDVKSTKTVQSFLYPLAFSDDIIEKYGSKTMNNDKQLELIEMCLDYLRGERKLDIDTNSVYEICNERCIGSIENLHSAFNYKPFDPEVEFKETFGDLSAKSEITLLKEEEELEEELTELKITKDVSKKVVNKVLIEELDVPNFQVDHLHKRLSVEVALPNVKSLREVELDISETLLHLEIPSQPSFKPVHLAFPLPISVKSAEAKFLRKQSKLFIVANFK